MYTHMSEICSYLNVNAHLRRASTQCVFQSTSGSSSAAFMYVYMCIYIYICIVEFDIHYINMCIYTCLNTRNDRTHIYIYIYTNLHSCVSTNQCIYIFIFLNKFKECKQRTCEITS